MNKRCCEPVLIGLLMCRHWRMLLKRESLQCVKHRAAWHG